MNNKHLERAEALCEIERWHEAIHELGKALADEPHNYRALCHLSRCHIQLKEYDRALMFAQKAIEIDPTQEWAFRLQSSVYEHKKDRKKSFKAAQEAVKQEPQSTYALQTLAYSQMRRGKHNDAEQTAIKIRQIAPDSVEAHKTMGYVEFNKGNFEQAEINFKRALKLEATNYDSLNMLGETLLKRFDTVNGYKTRRKWLVEAMDCFRQAILTDPNRHEAKNNLKNANFKSLVTNPAILLPVSVSLLIIIVPVMNSKLPPELVPDLLKLDNKPPELLALLVISWLSLVAALYIIAARISHNSLTENHRKFIEIIEKTPVSGKIAAGFMLFFSSYPVLFPIVSLFTFDFEIFSRFNLLDWLTLFSGLTAFVINSILFLRYLGFKIFDNLFENKTPEK